MPIDFRACYLPDKYWGRGTILVPKNRIALDCRFKKLEDLFFDHVERENFEIFWIEQGVAGNVRLPGELNYAWYNDRFYHLEKINSEGYIQNGNEVDLVWVYYMEYDEWVNEWLHGSVDVTGTVSKTGDHELAAENIIQIAPVVRGTNTYQIYSSNQPTSQNIRIVLDNRVDSKRPIDDTGTWMNPEVLYEFIEHLSYLGDSVPWLFPHEGGLFMPIVATCGRYFNFKRALVDAVKRLGSKNLKVYDVRKDKWHYSAFKAKHALREVYAIAPSDFLGTYEICATENPHIKIDKNFLFFGPIWDLQKVNPQSLLPELEDKPVQIWPLLEAYTNLYGLKTDLDKAKLTQEAIYLFHHYFGRVIIGEPSEDWSYLGANERSKLHTRVTIKPHKPDALYWEDGRNLRDDIWWSSLFTDNIFTSRLIGQNFIYPPNTPKLYISFLREIGKDKLEPNSQHTIENTTKTAVQWFDSKNINELMKWLNQLNTWWSTNTPKLKSILPAMNNYTTNPIQFKTDTLHGNLVLFDNSSHKLIDENETEFAINHGAICLIPDYGKHAWKIASGTTFPGVLNLNAVDNDNPAQDKNENHEYTIIAELGSTEPKTDDAKDDFLHPRTDDWLNEKVPIYQRYGLIYIAVIKWLQDYKDKADKSPSDHNSFLFRYAPYANLWPEDEPDESKIYLPTFRFQFPLAGWGFNITEILEEYRDVNGRWISWDYIVEPDVREENPHLVNKYPRAFKDTNPGGSDEDDDIPIPAYIGVDDEKNMHGRRPGIGRGASHNALNEAVEVRLSILKEEDDPIHYEDNLNKTCELITKLWALYFGMRWDGSTNGAIFVLNDDLERFDPDEDDETESWNQSYEVIYNKPFNRRWFSASMVIWNYWGRDLNRGSSRPSIVTNNKRTLSYPATTRPLNDNRLTQWKPKENFRWIGYSRTYGAGDESDGSTKWETLNHLLSLCNENITIKGKNITYNTFKEDTIPTDIFQYIFNSENPWTLIGFEFKSTGKTASLFDENKTLKNDWKSLSSKTFHPNTRPDPTDFLVKAAYPLDVNNTHWNIPERILKTWKKIEIPKNIATLLNPHWTQSQFNPNHVGQLNLSSITTLEAALSDFKKRFEHELQEIAKQVASIPYVARIGKTPFYMFAHLRQNHEWEIELLSASPHVFEARGSERHNFVNTSPTSRSFEDVVARINSNFEVSVYGQRIPLKTRPDTSSDNIDIGFQITPITDVKQSPSSLWYLVEIGTDQDVQRIRIEVPKEATSMSNISLFEKESLMRTINYNAVNRQVEKELFQLDRNKFNEQMEIRSQRMDVERNREITNQSFQMASTAVGAFGASWWNPLSWGANLAQGALSLGNQAANMVFSKQLYDLNRQEHNMMASYGRQSMNFKAAQLNNKHLQSQENDRIALHNMQTNVNWTVNTNSLMYKVENEQLGLTDIHLIRYYPSGTQLDFLVKYYKEYGFSLLAPDQRCTGINDIVGHLQFSKITSNIHPNETIKKMIEERALNGITLVDNSDWHADYVEGHPVCPNPQPS